MNMNNSYDVEIVLNKMVPKIYSLISILCIIFVLLIIIFLPFKYKTYLKYNFYVCEIDNKYLLSSYLNNKELNNLINNNILIFNNKKYQYKIKYINEDNYVNSKNEITKLTYIDINLEDKYKINNYLITAKILKEDKKIFDYIIDYFKGGLK